MTTDTSTADETIQHTDATTTQKGGTAGDTPPAGEQSQDEKPETVMFTPGAAEETDAESEDTAKPDDEKEPEAKAEDAESKAPEKYEFEVPEGMPEGFEFDEVILGSVADVAREIDLTQEDAQKLVAKVWPTIIQREQEKVEQLAEDWDAEVRDDPRLGGDKYGETQRKKTLALRTFGGEAVEQLFAESPFGKKKEVVDFLASVGGAVSEDKFVGGKRGGESVDLTDPAVQERLMYPNSQ